MSDQKLLKVYALPSQLPVVLAASSAIWIGDWMDRREHQRRHPAE